MAGDLQGTDLRAEAAPTAAPSPPARVLPWLGGALVGLAMAAGVVKGFPRARRAVARWRARRQDASLAREIVAIRGIGEALAMLRREAGATRAEGGPEELAALAQECLGRQDFAGALPLLRRARELAPSSVKLRTEEAYCLHRLGDEEGALAAYEEAARMSETDGEANFFAAPSILRLGLDATEAETHFERALEKSPEMADDLDAWRDSFGPDFLRRFRVRRVLDAAARRLDRDDDGGP